MSPYELLAHLKYIYGGLHALNILALQNKMHHYHLDIEVFPEYINPLQDAQKQSKREGNPITEDALLLIVSNAMLTSDHFP